MIVRLDKEAHAQSQNSDKDDDAELEVTISKVSEADKIVMDTKQKIADGMAPAVGVSASNSGRGYDPVPISDGDFVPTTIDGAVEEEPVTTGRDESTNVVPVTTTSGVEAQESKQAPSS